MADQPTQTLFQKHKHESTLSQLCSRAIPKFASMLKTLSLFVLWYCDIKSDIDWGDKPTSNCFLNVLVIALKRIKFAPMRVSMCFVTQLIPDPWMSWIEIYRIRISLFSLRQSLKSQSLYLNHTVFV